MKRLLAGALGAVLALGGLAVATAAPASAHTPRVSATCTTLDVNLTQYADRGGRKNDVKVTVAGEVVEQTTFGTSFSKTYTIPDPAVATAWEVDIKAWDDPNGRNNWTRTITGTTEPCLEREVGLYVYKKIDKTKPAAWENSGKQTFITSRPGSEWFTEFPGDLPTWLCGDEGWAVQQDRVIPKKIPGTDFTWPQHITYPDTVLVPWMDFPNADLHQDISAIGVTVPECAPDVVELPAPPAPTFVDQCGTENDEILAEDTEEYTYTVVEGQDGQVTVTVTPNEGYAFPEDATTEWTFEFTDAPCEQDTAALPELPVIVDLCGVENDGYELPEDSDAFTYDITEDGYLLAYPNPGYAFDESTETETGFVVVENGALAVLELDLDVFTDEPCDLIPGDVEAVCIGDVPFLGYEVFLPEGFEAESDNPLSITFLNPDGDDFRVGGLPLAGDLLWPGASDVEPLQWPGWEQLEDGSYVETDGNFAWTRAGVQVLFEVNPGYSTVVDYPEATADCANPPADLPQAGGNDGDGLAATGTTVTVVAVLAFLLVAGGVAFVVLRRRANA